jgi:hypothetical protein
MRNEAKNQGFFLLSLQISQTLSSFGDLFLPKKLPAFPKGSFQFLLNKKRPVLYATGLGVTRMLVIR